jgi:dihydroorotase/N-acyl-D-amino-acid deacylase
MRLCAYAPLSLVLALLLPSCATRPTAKMMDLKITHARILDGTGAPWFYGDIGVRGDTIVAIGDLANEPAKSTLDAQQRIVSPGFIDLLGWSQTSVLEDPQLEAKVRQGVTTEIGGEGNSPGPATSGRFRTLAQYLDTIDKQGATINFAMLLGASNPREMVIGDVNRVATMDEMLEMERITDQAMRDGAIGIGSSLIYVPAMYSTSEELINISRVAAKYDGVYFSHIRDEGDHIDDALDEAFRIGREAKIPVNVWHIKVGGRANWGKMPHVIERIENARAEGIDVAANIYPYAASSTGLSTLAPNWALEGGYDDFQKRLANPDDRAKIAEAFRAQFAKRGERGIYVSQIYAPSLAQYEKKFIEQIASEMGVPVEDALIKLFEESKPSPRVIFFSINEDDMRYALKQPFVSVGSDAGAATSERQKNAAVHPRAYGTFPRILGKYVRDEHLLTLEDAIRKMTSQAAARVHFKDRGILREGMKADIVIFDPATIHDVATFEDPHHFSEGITDVIVNGVPVLRGGALTGALPGRSIRGRGYVKK